MYIYESDINLCISISQLKNNIRTQTCPRFFRKQPHVTALYIIMEITTLIYSLPQDWVWCSVCEPLWRYTADNISGSIPSAHLQLRPFNTFFPALSPPWHQMHEKNWSDWCWRCGVDKCTNTAKINQSGRCWFPTLFATPGRQTCLKVYIKAECVSVSQTETWPLCPTSSLPWSNPAS